MLVNNIKNHPLLCMVLFIYTVCGLNHIPTFGSWN